MLFWGLGIGYNLLQKEMNKVSEKINRFLGEKEIELEKLKESINYNNEELNILSEGNPETSQKLENDKRDNALNEKTQEIKNLEKLINII